MNIDAKLRPLYLAKILKERTDEDHFLSTAELCDILKNEYGLETHRTTLKKDIELLRQAGFDIQIERTERNRFNFIGHEFDAAELKLLIDAVLASKFVPDEKSQGMVAKLTSLAGMHKAQALKRNLVADGCIKCDNRKILLIVDVINEAINAGKKIRFRKFDYNVQKEPIPHNNGEVYIFSPYTMIWDGDYYYLVGFSDKYGRVGSHRVDRIRERPEITDEDVVPPPADFDINRYRNTMFRMYDAPRKTVELLCHNSVMNTVIDRFGRGAETEVWDQNRFRLTAEVAVGNVFYAWVFGFRGKVQILGPDDVREEYRRIVLAAAETLG